MTSIPDDIHRCSPRPSINHHARASIGKAAIIPPYNMHFQLVRDITDILCGLGAGTAGPSGPGAAAAPAGPAGLWAAAEPAHASRLGAASPV